MAQDPRYTRIAQRLGELGYKLAVCHPGRKKTRVAYFECWVNPALGASRLIQVFVDGEGFEVYKPIAEQSNNLADTLEGL